VLAGQVAGPVGDVEDEADDTLRLRDERDNLGQRPTERSQGSRRDDDPLSGCDGWFEGRTQGAFIPKRYGRD
jgi:hypothetical protein